MISRYTLVGIVIAFLFAEILRPTSLHSKKILSRALLTASQDSPIPRMATVDPELLNDLPRIRPDAPGSMTRDASGTIRGTIIDPYTQRPGLAVFPLLDDIRVTNFAASYREGRYTITLLTGSQSHWHRAALGLITIDQRGYFKSQPSLERSTP